MRYKRSTQVGAAMSRELSLIVQQELKDPRLAAGLVTVSGVELSDDLKFAKVFVSVLGNEDSRRTSLVGLESAKGYIRKLLGERMKLKYLPEIVFKEDHSFEEGDKIDRLIDSLHQPNGKSGS
jgi:ribosome-binding factor A